MAWHHNLTSLMALCMHHSSLISWMRCQICEWWLLLQFKLKFQWIIQLLLVSSFTNSDSFLVAPMQKREQAPHYKDFKLIGNGAFGYVFKAIDSSTDKPVAIKRSQKVGSKVSREFEVLAALKEKPNVVQLVDFFYSLDSRERLI